MRNDPLFICQIVIAATDTNHFCLFVEEYLEDPVCDGRNALPHSGLVFDDQVILQVQE